jgi:cytochrome bd-type quinol oxidase subunit 2
MIRYPTKGRKKETNNHKRKGERIVQANITYDIGLHYITLHYIITHHFCTPPHLVTLYIAQVDGCGWVRLACGLACLVPYLFSSALPHLIESNIHINIQVVSHTTSHFTCSSIVVIAPVLLLLVLVVLPLWVWVCGLARLVFVVLGC